jgi:phage terminase large subunit-like protein
LSEALQYANWVLDPENNFRTGNLIKLAAKRFISDLERDDIFFDEDEAVKWVNFMERYCYQWEGEWRGKPLVLEPWQKFHLEQLAGWIRKDTGTRRFTKFFLQISKKNGKSTECAGISLNHIFADERVNTPKVFTAANNEDQAKICVNMAGRIIEQSPDLYSYVEDKEVKLSTYGSNITEVIHLQKDGFIKALSKEGGDKNAKTAGGKHGINASLGLVDEFGMSPDHGASGSIYTSMAARSERLMAYLTTAGYNMAGPCYAELRDQGIKVLTGVIKMDNYLPIIYELDRPIGEDGKEKAITIEYLLEHPEVWQQSNPNLGISVNKEYLQEMLLNAKSLGGTTEVDVKTLNFNMWVDSPEVFIPAEKWNKNSHGISEDDLLQQDCYGGIELAGGKLLNAFCFLFPNIKGKTVIKLLFWMPEGNKSNKETDSYDQWIKDGHINTFLGEVSDNDKVHELIMEEMGKYNMHSFAYKTNLENNDIVQSLIKNAIEGNPISHGYQGISTPTSTWEEMITAGQMEHFDNPVLSWMNSNCMAVRKDNDIRLEKSGSRVVGIYAAINALAQWKTIESEGLSDFTFTSMKK